MNLETFSVLVLLIAVPTWFVVDRLEQLRIELLSFNRREEAKDSERLDQRKRVIKALREAVQTLNDPQYEAMDYSLGTGHGHRRAKRIVEAKNFDEIYRIISHEDVPTELDQLDYREAIDERESNGSLFANPIPKGKELRWT